MGKLVKIDQKKNRKSPNLSPFLGTKFQDFLLDISIFHGPSFAYHRRSPMHLQFGPATKALPRDAFSWGQ